MEEQADHILPKPETMPEPAPASSEAESLRELAPAPLAAESSSEQLPASTDPESALDFEPASTEAETTAEHAPMFVALEATLEAEQALAEAETTAEHASMLNELEAELEPVLGPPAPEIVLERVPGYLSIRETARLMGVSERSVYGYIEAGKLPGARIGNIIVVVADYVEAYERKAPGRIRTTTPPWHMPPLRNLQFLTTIIARLRPGQGDLLEHRLYEIRASKKHRLLGTAARYIARNQHDPDEIEIVLIWRSVVMPPVDVRESALAAFYDELADIIDWETVSRKEGRVLMHA